MTNDQRPLRTQQYFLIFLLLWLAINLLQAGFTGLLDDEAYYYFYSLHPAWGYYDHPPFVAIFIRLGYILFHHEIGVRFLYVLLSVFTLFIIHRLSEARNELLFSLVAFSFMVIQVTGFMALPDSLLVFFTSLFFLAYRKYSRSYSYMDAILLGLVMAGLFYSKYLGILVVFFTVISDFRLLLKRSFWLAVITTTILFLPHLAWQYQHDFPSLYYHLLERSHDEMFRWGNFADYILGQFLQANPLLFIPFIYFLVKFKPLNKYDRALKFSALGCFLLPFLMMIKGRVEANWTMAGLIPFFIISYRMIENQPKLKRFLYFSSGFTIIFIILIRVLLVYNFLPEDYLRKVKFYQKGWETLSEKVSVLAGDRPVVFNGSYQNPSQYTFFTGKKAFSFNNALYRGNQYDLSGIEQTLQGKEVLYITNIKSIAAEEVVKYGLEKADSIRYPNGKYRSFIYDTNYRSYNFIRADIRMDNYEVKAGENFSIPVLLKNPGNIPVRFAEASPCEVDLCLYILKYGKPVYFNVMEDISTLVLEDEYRTTFTARAPLEPGEYYMKVSIKRGWMPPGINSRLIKIRVR
jgi:hypothetical protein